MFKCFLSLFVSVEVADAYVNVLSIIVFFSINFIFLDMFYCYYFNINLIYQVNFKVLFSVQLECVFFFYKTDTETRRTQNSTISVPAICFGYYIAMIMEYNTPSYLKHVKVLV
jgi:hypothetical protein